MLKSSWLSSLPNTWILFCYWNWKDGFLILQNANLQDPYFLSYNLFLIIDGTMSMESVAFLSVQLFGLLWISSSRNRNPYSKINECIVQNTEWKVIIMLNCKEMVCKLPRWRFRDFRGRDFQWLQILKFFIIFMT